MPAFRNVADASFELRRGHILSIRKVLLCRLKVEEDAVSTIMSGDLRFRDGVPSPACVWLPACAVVATGTSNPAIACV